ncbi:DeoR/GlpR family DNA-binding transcription regulator [Alteromonas confluentis]|nr:DeoR/GlpR family DNA-binding transcription regulator [Alteromonas confluentis]
MTDRQTAMLELVELHRSMSVSELSKQFAVSEETIRRDIKQLESAGRVEKIHGGVRLPATQLEPPYWQRVNRSAEVKKRIGLKAAEQVQDGMTVFIDSGTTSYWLAKALTSQKNLTVTTNSLEVAAELAGRPDCKLVIVGGVVDMDYRAAFGVEAISQASRYVPDILFLSAGGVSADGGWLDFSHDEADFKRALLPLARKKVVVTDSSKFEAPGTVQFAALGDVDVLISEQQPAPPLAAALQKAGVAVDYAPQ